MTKFIRTALTFVIIIVAGCKSSQPIVHVDPGDLAQYVNPFIGTSGYVQAEPGVPANYDTVRNKKAVYAFGGLVFPGATVPFGMIQLSPDCNKNNNQLGWSAGYQYADTSLLGFSHMHTSGNGMSFGHFLFLPVIKSDSLPESQYISGEIRNFFDHKNEDASPGYYAVQFTNCNIKAELTATARVGVHRYTYHSSENASLIINLVHGLGNYSNLVDANLTIDNDSIISGFRLIDEGVKTYFVAHFSAPILKTTLYDGTNYITNIKSLNGKSIKALLSFGKLNKPLIIRVGLSFCSIAGAERNIQTETPNEDFDYYRLQARACWNRQLSKIILKEGKKDDVIKFYTSLYHASLAPFEFSDADSNYLCADNTVRKSIGFKNYTFFSLWDTYRALNPLHTLINADRVNDMMQSMVVQAEYSKNNVMPMWSLASRNYSNMAGYSAATVIAEAYEKGFRGFDAQKSLLYIKNNLKSGIYPGYEDYVKFGFLPCDMYNASVPRTLEYAFSDWNAGKLCSLLGDKDSSKFYIQSENYLNLADPVRGFIRPRYRNGKWKEPFDPRRVSHHQPGDDYMESNAWQNNWLVMQNIPGLFMSLGGNQKCIWRLDSLFEQPGYLTGSYAADVSGLIGQYAQGNQPDHHVAYLYALAGVPYKTQFRIKEIADSTYKNAPDGLPGNDDSGEMSAWLVFSSIGFYPVNPASGNYVIGTPLFSHAEILVGANRINKFIVEAKNISDKNIYIQSAILNGKPFDQTCISHTDIVKGGQLIFKMGNKPSDWGRKGHK